MSTGIDFPHYLCNEGIINDNQLEEIMLISQHEHLKFGQIVLSKHILDKNRLISLLKDYSRK